MTTTATALVLDVQHRALVVDGALVTVPVPAGDRPLATLEQHARTRFGLELAMPLGRAVPPGPGGDALFVFVLPELAAPTLGELVPLRAWSTRPAFARAWDLYVSALLGGWQPPTRDLEVYYFGDGPLMAARLAHLIIKGTKRGSSGWIAALDQIGWTAAVVGMLAIVTDGFGIPLCAIETTRVERGAFRDATAEIATAEGEGDLSFTDWHAGHRAYFEAEAARTGLAFTDDAELLYEYFDVRHVFGRA